LLSESRVPDELRIEANRILRDYAELARTEIEVLHQAGMFDTDAMARIKQDTRVQAADELRNRLSVDAFEEIFPTEVTQ
jgi:hypothetical protein